MYHERGPENGTALTPPQRRAFATRREDFATTPALTYSVPCTVPKAYAPEHTCNITSVSPTRSVFSSDQPIF